MSARGRAARAGPDLRLVLPAAGAWAAAWLIVEAPSLATAVAVGAWAVAGVVVAAGLVVGGGAMVAGGAVADQVAAAARSTMDGRGSRGARGRRDARGRRGVRAWAAQAAACLAAVALVCTVVAVRAPERQPAGVLELAGHGRALSVLVVASERIAPGARDGPVAARLVAVATRGSQVRGSETGSPNASAPLALSTPVLVFGGETARPAGIGATLRLDASLTAAASDDDIGFLLFAEGEARVVAGPRPSSTGRTDCAPASPLPRRGCRGTAVTSCPDWRSATPPRSAMSSTRA